jgi:hypothetical protein
VLTWLLCCLYAGILLALQPLRAGPARSFSLPAAGEAITRRVSDLVSSAVLCSSDTPCQLLDVLHHSAAALGCQDMGTLQPRHPQATPQCCSKALAGHTQPATSAAARNPPRLHTQSEMPCCALYMTTVYDHSACLHHKGLWPHVVAVGVSARPCVRAVPGSSCLPSFCPCTVAGARCQFRRCKQRQGSTCAAAQWGVLKPGWPAGDGRDAAHS